jgi:hypothetical protein
LCGGNTYGGAQPPLGKILLRSTQGTRAHWLVTCASDGA